MTRPASAHLASVLASLVLLAPASAQAHLVATGMGPLYDGVSHFALTPEDNLPVTALGFFAGLRGPAHARLLSWMVPVAWFAGGLLAMMAATPPELTLSAATAVLFLLVGALLAANLELSIAACTSVGVVLALARGMADLAEVRESSAHVLTLFGMCATLFVTIAISASMTLPLKRLWIIVVARVCGSWLAALGLLLAGWILRYGAMIH
jgi:urease accessory protein